MDPLFSTHRTAAVENENYWLVEKAKRLVGPAAYQTWADRIGLRALYSPVEFNSLIKKFVASAEQTRAAVEG